MSSGTLTKVSHPPRSIGDENGRQRREGAFANPSSGPVKEVGVFGNLDKGIPPASVDAFEAAMKAAGKDLKVQRYDANHAFANPSSGRYELNRGRGGV